MTYDNRGHGRGHGHAPEADEETLRALYTAYDRSPVPQTLVSTEGTFLLVNRAGADLLGYDQEELRGKDFGYITGEQSLADAIQIFLDLVGGEHDTVRRDIWFERRDGSAIEVEIVTAAVRGEDGAIVYFTSAAYDVTERREAERTAHHRAAHDALTELPNRSWFTSRLSQAVAHAEREGSLLGVFFVDLDGFKEVNDAHGHGAGDEVLFTLAGRLDRCVRPGDTLARYGGDEFTILCEDLPGEAQANEIAERILHAVEQPIRTSAGELRLAASVGVALGNPGETTPNGLITTADLAMYEAKRAGRGRYRVMRAAADR